MSGEKTRLLREVSHVQHRIVVVVGEADSTHASPPSHSASPRSHPFPRLHPLVRISPPNNLTLKEPAAFEDQ